MIVWFPFFISYRMSIDNNNSSINCSICFEECQDKRKLAPCNHEFCKQCIVKWSEKCLTNLAVRDPVVVTPKVTCPNCRRPISAYILATSSSSGLVKEPVDLSPFRRERQRIAQRQLEQITLPFQHNRTPFPRQFMASIISDVSIQVASMHLPEAKVPEVRAELMAIMMNNFISAPRTDLDSHSFVRPPPSRSARRPRSSEVIDLTESDAETSNPIVFTAPAVQHAVNRRRRDPDVIYASDVDSYLRRSNRLRQRVDEYSTNL